jgi:bacterioferritin
MIGNPEVIQALQAALAQEAHLNIQYRHDWRLVAFWGIKKTAKKMHCFGGDAHDWMRKVADRILILGGETNYSVGDIVDQSTLTEVFQNELRLEMEILQPYEMAIQTAMRAFDDATRNLFEHLIKWHQQHVGWLEQQLRLIDAVGGEGEYVAEKL